MITLTLTAREATGLLDLLAELRDERADAVFSKLIETYVTTVVCETAAPYSAPDHHAVLCTRVLGGLARPSDCEPCAFRKFGSRCQEGGR
jgi:hypothetical protein